MCVTPEMAMGVAVVVVLEVALTAATLEIAATGPLEETEVTTGNTTYASATATAMPNTPAAMYGQYSRSELFGAFFVLMVCRRGRS